MKFRIFGSAAAALLLTGCGGADGVGDTKLFIDAMDAYRAGDRAALAATLEAFDAANPQQSSGLKLEPCSPEAWDQRRTAHLRGLIDNLDRPTVFSMSEEARLVYFDAVVLGEVEPSEADTPDCQNTPDFKTQQIKHVALHTAALRAFSDRHSAWRKELEEKYGDSLNARLNQGARTLMANRMIPQSDEPWTGGGDTNPFE